MKKKAIEKIPYFGLEKVSRKKQAKYIGVSIYKSGRNSIQSEYLFRADRRCGGKHGNCRGKCV